MNAKSNKEPSADSGMSRKERRAAERAARKSGGSRSASSGSDRSVPLIAGGAIVIALVVVAIFIFAGGGIGDDDYPPVSAAEFPPPAEELQHGRSLGDPAAPVKIEVYEDPQCPACGAYNKDIEPLLRAGPIARGEVFLTYKDMAFLGQESFDAAAAMRVAEALDGKFWAFHDVVFDNQHDENGGAFTAERLADMAEIVGLDRQEFLTALEDPQYIAAVEQETGEARVLGVSSTPTLVVNGNLQPGVPNWEELRDQIAAAVDAANA